MGRDAQMQYIGSTCSQCSVGCGMKVVTRNDSVLRIEGDWDAEVNGGLLCQTGRFAPLYDGRERLTKPLLRRNGSQETAGWDEALRVVAERLGGGKKGKLGVLTSSNATNEALYLVGRLFRNTLQTPHIGLLNGVVSESLGKSEGSFADLSGSDLIVLVGADPVKEQPVVSFLVKRTVDEGGRLIVVDGEENGLAPFACMTLGMDGMGQAVEMAGRAANPVVLYGAGVSNAAADVLKRLQGKAAFIALEPGVNSRAAKAFGLAGSFMPSDVEVLYLLLGEQDCEDADLPRKIGKDSFVVVQSSFASPITRCADVVLPMAIWSERSGSLTNTEGRILKVNRAVDPVGEAKPDWEILALLADRLGVKIGSSLEDVTAALRK